MQVPQRYTEVFDDGDGFCFAGRILAVHGKGLATVRFDYIGDTERYSLALVKQWLQPEFDDLSRSLLELSTVCASS